MDYEEIAKLPPHKRFVPLFGVFYPLVLLCAVLGAIAYKSL